MQNPKKINVGLVKHNATFDKKLMGLEDKVKAIKLLYSTLNIEIETFKQSSGLSCTAGCSKCCSKTDIYASPLEFLPWAFELFLRSEAEQKLEILKVKKSTICNIYNPFSIQNNFGGGCMDYPNRGLICRLFGFSANPDKYGHNKLVTCKTIKIDKHPEFNTTEEKIKVGLKLPIIKDQYSKLSQIDFRLGNTLVPINKAQILAIEEVLQYYSYRPTPIVITEIA